MSILKRQQRIAEVGIIRIGEKGPGGKYPKSRDTFRFTSKQKELLEKAQEAYGGELRPWAGMPGQWELLSEAATIKALFSTRETGDGDLESLIQHYEQWAGNTCIKRCNGQSCDVWKEVSKDSKGKPVFERETVPCECDPDDRDCKLVSRVRVILTEVPALGMWRLNTGSEVFADELEGLINQIQSFGLDQFGPTPVTLSIGFREKRTGPGAPTSKFPVVDVALDHSPVSLPTLVGRIQQSALAMVRPDNGIGALPIASAPALQPRSTVPPEIRETVLSFLEFVGVDKTEQALLAQEVKAAGFKWTDVCLEAKEKRIADLDDFRAFLTKKINPDAVEAVYDPLADVEPIEGEIVEG